MQSTNGTSKGGDSFTGLYIYMFAFTFTNPNPNPNPNSNPIPIPLNSWGWGAKSKIGLKFSIQKLDSPLKILFWGGRGISVR